MTLYDQKTARNAAGDPTKGLFGTIVLGDNPGSTVPKIDISGWQYHAGARQPARACVL
ncbi:hypothetical protein HHL17_15755 [Chitinophaga sp. G-6-1-13]|uniref:Uncharacterized protein n=1 Tax=Chitinophaga fulva TaxID=2728842 RepID=A0A848GPE7_9BACT|nr:hypothetical protein [Chitinophaga fulva]NML38663.1 hypothetical protein [Chitinophaga fulva]